MTEEVSDFANGHTLCPAFSSRHGAFILTRGSAAPNKFRYSVVLEYQSS